MSKSKQKGRWREPCGHHRKSCWKDSGPDPGHTQMTAAKSPVHPSQPASSRKPLNPTAAHC